MENKAQDDDLVMNLVELALGQTEQERRAYLQRACTGETELFEQAWEYVQWESRMQGFLLEPLYSPPVNEHPFEAGELLDGRFRILREIAQGGMGVVYEAMDERLDRRIAIKCAKTGFRKRLPPEVRHAREISHPNVCKIFEIHTTRTSAGEMDFVTMEYLEGETLADRLKRGPLPEAEARAIARQLCSGLAEAHGQGVIHGDLKSNNVILTKVADASTRSVITDFGMSRATETAQSTLQSGPRGGTPDYMAPELLQGEKASVASDVYALGVMLHELVSGRKPAAGAAIAVHPKWNSIVAKCLAADPKHRYANATQIAQAFEPPRTRRWFLMAAAAVLVATITGVVTYQRATAPKEVVRLAMLPFTYSADLAPVAEGVFREASANLAKLRGGAKVRYSEVPLAEIQRAKVETPEQAKSVFGATHVLHGTLTPEQNRLVLHVLLTDTRTGVNAKEWKTEYAPGQVRYMPVALAGFVTGALHLPPLAILNTVNVSAQQYYLSGLSYLHTDTEADAALASMQHAATLDPDSPLVYAGLAAAQWFKYFVTQEKPWLDSMAESVRQAELRDMDLAEVHIVVGVLRANEGWYDQAAAHYRRAIELQPTNGEAYRRLGMVYEKSNQLDDALASLQMAIRVRPGDYQNYQDLGTYYGHRSNYPAAILQFQRMVELAPASPDAHFALGSAYGRAGTFTNAAAEHLKSIQLQDTSRAESSLAYALLHTGRLQEAIWRYERAMMLGGETTLRWTNLGMACSLAGRTKDAQSAFRRALALARQDVIQNPRDGLSHALLAYLAAMLSDPASSLYEVAQASQLSPNDWDTRMRAILTYEALGRRSNALALLAGSTSAQVAELNRYPGIDGLRRDPYFVQLLISNQVQ